jgi:hypothetical protein
MKRPCRKAGYLRCRNTWSLGGCCRSCQCKGETTLENVKKSRCRRFDGPRVAASLDCGKASQAPPSGNRVSIFPLAEEVVVAVTGKLAIGKVRAGYVAVVCGGWGRGRGERLGGWLVCGVLGRVPCGSIVAALAAIQ